MADAKLKKTGQLFLHDFLRDVVTYSTAHPSCEMCGAAAVTTYRTCRDEPGGTVTTIFHYVCADHLPIGGRLNG